MNANEHNEQEGKNNESLINGASAPQNAIENNRSDKHDEAHRKKYHSSAMYAASKVHDVVGYVKPTHTTRINP